MQRTPPNARPLDTDAASLNRWRNWLPGLIVTSYWKREAGQRWQIVGVFGSMRRLKNVDTGEVRTQDVYTMNLRYERPPKPNSNYNPWKVKPK